MTKLEIATACGIISIGVAVGCWRASITAMNEQRLVERERALMSRPVEWAPAVATPGHVEWERAKPSACQPDSSEAPSWVVKLGGSRLGDPGRCRRCDRVLRGHEKASGHNDYSDEVLLEAPVGRVVFDGCIWCLRDVIDGVSWEGSGSR